LYSHYSFLDLSVTFTFGQWHCSGATVSQLKMTPHHTGVYPACNHFQ